MLQNASLGMPNPYLLFDTAIMQVQQARVLSTDNFNNYV